MTSVPKDAEQTDRAPLVGVPQDDWAFLRTLFRGAPHKQTEARRCLFAGMCRILPLLPSDVLADIANLGEEIMYRPDDVDVDSTVERLAAKGMIFRNDDA